MSRYLNILIAVVSLVWASLTIYTEIIDEDPDQYSIKSPAVRQQMENCTGTYAQRSACAERISDTQEQLGFLVWCEKVAIILGPPLVLWGLATVATRQRSPRPAPAPRRTAAGTAPVRPKPRRVMADDPASRDLPREPEPPSRGSDGPADGTLFTGGRREPVRRRDR